ncbi:type I-E CRISPR-associated protein Cse2/CasB [Streptomyces sp. NPDC052042]|uniref:type I-E CRISPR-associated protein Cse2/CasB n=1 Tax=Streptomyces sp. NPDC052042 TaxID=3365683 RepID=UPI0037D87EE2
MTTSTASGGDSPIGGTTQQPASTDGPDNPSATRSEEPTLRAVVEQVTRSSITRLQSRYLRDDPAAVAELARLRRGAGKRAHEVQDLWGVGPLDDLAALLAERSEPTRQREAKAAEAAEEAVFLATTLWALHQQSRREDGMHADKRQLGGAVRALIQQHAAPGADEENSPLRTRLVRVGTAESLDSVAVRLREIVLLLRAASEPLDYARLAGQLYRWQHRPDRPGVQREWGREFHLAAAPRGRKQRTAADGTGAGDEVIDRTLPADEEETYGGYAAGE